MRRDKNLVPLSHQHHHALALCVFIERALKSGNADVAHWNAEIARQFEAEIGFHFEAEETLLFPRARGYKSLEALVTELLHEHRALRGQVERAARGELPAPELQEFASTLAHHVHNEERQLFEELQRVLTAEQMEQLGSELERYFRDSGMAGAACELPK